MSLAKAVQRFDSFVNAITGLGDRTRDKTLGIMQQYDGVLSPQYIENLLATSDLAWTITAEMLEEAMKDGFSLSTKAGNMEPARVAEQAQAILLEGERIGFQDKLLEAAIWGRGYGFGALILGVTGAGLPTEPLRDDAPNARLSWLLVSDRREMQPIRYYNDPNADKFGEVEIYRINPASNAGVAGVDVHETRVIRFGGALTSRRERQRNQGADFSVMQRILPVLEQSEQNWASLCQLMADMSQGVFSVQGLLDMIASGNEAALVNRMKLLDMSRSVARAIVLDAQSEKFERVQTPMQGVNEVLVQTWQRLAAAARMPLTVLMGVSPAGLNATGASDIRLWYDKINRAREHVLAPRILKVVKLIAQGLGQSDPGGWGVVWPSLWKMSAPEQADLYFKMAQADALYIANRTYRPEEVALSRNGSGDEFNVGKVAIDVKARQLALKSEPPATDPSPPDGKDPTGSPPDGTRSIDNASADESDDNDQ